jgi:hypothetical protein
LLEEGEMVELWLGIASDESHRANPPQNPPTWMRNKVFKYPFVEFGIARQENIDIITRNGF